MDVILRQDVDALGLRGEVVNVARGYARNFLLPRGLAEPATPALVRELAKRDLLARRQEAKTTDDARAIARRVEAIELRFDVNAGPTGSLFGSVTATNVADRLWEQEKIRVDRRKLSMDTIKRVGRYTVPVELFADVVAELKLAVAPEGQELPTEDGARRGRSRGAGRRGRGRRGGRRRGGRRRSGGRGSSRRGRRAGGARGRGGRRARGAGRRRPDVATSPSPTARRARPEPVCPQASPPACGQRSTVLPPSVHSAAASLGKVSGIVRS